MGEWLPRAYAEHGAAIAAGSHTVRELARLIGMSRSSAHRLCRYVREHGPPDDPGDRIEIKRDGDAVEVTSPRGQIRNLGDLLDAAGIDLAEWRVAKWICNKWDAASAQGVRSCWQVKAWLERRIGADLRPVIAPIVHVRTDPPTRSAPVRVAVFVPDTQHGFRRERDGSLTALHSRAAIDAVWQLCAALQPDEILLLGDHLDLAEFSTRYPRDPAHRGVTAAAVAELSYNLAQLRAECPSALIRYIEGNHDARIARALVDRPPLDALIGMRPADDPEGHDVLSIPRLLALDSMGIQYVGPYPAGEVWLWDRVRVTHGETARAGGGKTAVANLAKSKWSEVYGHIHRCELVARTYHGPSGPETITAMSPGCLCRIDGTVPGAARPDAQQGVGLGYLDEGGQVHLQVLPIREGRLVFGGIVIQGEDRAAEIAQDLGLPQLAPMP